MPQINYIFMVQENISEQGWSAL